MPKKPSKSQSKSKSKPRKKYKAPKVIQSGWEMLETKEEPVHLDYNILIDEIHRITGFPINIIYEILFYSHKMLEEEVKEELTKEFKYIMPSGHCMWYTNPSLRMECYIITANEKEEFRTIEEKQVFIYRVIRYFLENRNTIIETTTTENYRKIVSDINRLIRKYLPPNIDEYYKNLK